MSEVIFKKKKKKKTWVGVSISHLLEVGDSQESGSVWE